jgi:L-ascorbate metabolism protein UlaG (beta-lactamase superfamily)
MNRTLAAAFLTATALMSQARADQRDTNDPRFAPPPREMACRVLQTASAGGPTLKDHKALAVRWLGFSNFELIYGDKIILLDNYYDRGPRYRYLGFSAADVKRADLIIVGHAHFDHMSDTAQVMSQTRAPVIAAPITVSKLMMQGVDPSHVKTVTGTGGELLKFDGFTVQAILARHGEPQLAPSTREFGEAYAAAAPATSEQRAAEEAIRAKGSADPHIVDQGTMAYVITFDTGFRVAYRDSGGFMTDYEKSIMSRIGPVDVLLGAVAANTIAESNAAVLMPMIDTYQPAVYFPAHHEEEVGRNVDRATEPMFQYIKNKYPGTVTVSKEFREPTCFDTRFNIRQGNARTSALE